MENQLPLFASGARRAETPAARATDPITSHIADQRHKRSGDQAFQRALAVATVNAYPGRTSFELAMKSGHDRHMLARRLPECARQGLVKKGVIVECTITRHKAISWWPAE